MTTGTRPDLVAPGLVTIDCRYVMPRFAASYLMLEGDEAAFIETNTAHCIPRLLEQLRRAGRSAEQVRYVMVTHVHLDHAGGASALMQICPNATLLAHPRAAKHLIDPSRLVKSARQVYGDEAFEKMYGDIQPIPASRIRTMADEETLTFGKRKFRFLHTRGHANHHFCVLDSCSQSIFTGDSFGLAYPALQNRGLLIFPSTSPTDFDPIEAKKSVDRILATGAQRAYLTHFGEISALTDAARQLHQHLDFCQQLLEEAVAAPLTDSELEPMCYSRLLGFYDSWLTKETGLSLRPSVFAIIGMDLELNAAGIAHVAAKRRHPPESVQPMTKP